MKKKLLAWIITDGKVGDLNPCIAIAEALGLNWEEKSVKTSWLSGLLMPFGPIEYRNRPNNPASIFFPPFPDLVFASGRRAIAYSRAIKELAISEGRALPYFIYLKDPRAYYEVFDFIWMPQHDLKKVRKKVVKFLQSGLNKSALLKHSYVFSTLGAPHSHSQKKLEKHFEYMDQEIKALPSPKIGLILGGDVKGYPFKDADCQRFVQLLSHNRHQFGSVLLTRSRRTPQALYDAVKLCLKDIPLFECDSEPLLSSGKVLGYRDLLACSDCFIVTGDSHNLVSECMASTSPVYVFKPRKLPAKLDYFNYEILKNKIAYPLHDTLSFEKTVPIDSTMDIAKKIEHLIVQKCLS